MNTSHSESRQVTGTARVCVMGDTEICHQYVACVLGGRVGVSETQCCSLET